LLVPRDHYETLTDLPAHLVPVLFVNVRIIALAVEQGMAADGTFIAINNRVSQSVPHLHIHIVPRRKKDGLRGFFWPRQPYTDRESMLKTQHAIRSAIARLQDE
jgi:histidine triad (HIT) family protein